MTVIVDPQSSDPALETALVLLGQLRRDEAIALIAERADAESKRTNGEWFGFSATRAGAVPARTLPPRTRCIAMRSERRFLKDAETLLRDPKWQPDWVLDDGSVTDATRKLVEAPASCSSSATCAESQDSGNCGKRE